MGRSALDVRHPEKAECCAAIQTRLGTRGGHRGSYVVVVQRAGANINQRRFWRWHAKRKGWTRVSISVSNAPGVWGNASGDAMFESYIFSQNGSDIRVAVRDLEPGRYYFHLYGHADATA
jgi:hypothetical protein